MNALKSVARTQRVNHTRLPTGTEISDYVHMHIVGVNC